MSDCDPILKIHYGSESIDLLRVDQKSALAPIEGGISGKQYLPHQYDRHLQSLDDLKWIERYTVNMKEVDTDGLAVQWRKLVEMLRNAWKYQNRTRFKIEGPVYLEERARGESESRYAVVDESPDLSVLSPIAVAQFEQAGVLADTGISIARYIWSDTVPGTISNTTSLTQVYSEDQTLDDVQHIANRYDDVDLTHIYVDDGGVFGVNLVASNSFNYFPAAPAVNDAIYFGADEPFFLLALYVATAASWTGVTTIWSISEGAGAWQVITAGAFEAGFVGGSGATDIWESIGPKVLCIMHDGADSWAKDTVNTQNKYWLRCVITAHTATVTVPAQGSQVVYTVNRPYLNIAENALKGDAPPYMIMNMFGMYGGDENTSPLNTSLIIVGSRSRHLDTFESHFNLSSEDLPTGWTAAAGDDTTLDTVVTYGPAGYSADIDFSTETQVVMRVRLSGTNLLPYFIGEYRPFLLCEQSGGDAGDVSVKLRVGFFGTDDDDPKYDTDEVVTQAVDLGIEIIDLTPGDFLKIPPMDLMGYETLTGGDLYLEIHAGREAGSAATFALYTLILIPVDEWSGEFRDPITLSNFGTSSLRGYKMVQEDSGLLLNRCSIYYGDDDYWNSPNLWPSEGWMRRQKPISLEPKLEHKLYFLIGHFPEGEDWGSAPFMADMGAYLGAQLFHANTYMMLRGDETA